MARGLSAGAQTEVAAQVGRSVHLIEINHSGGVIRLTDAPVDVDADVGEGVRTWTGIGGRVGWESSSETPDLGGQGTVFEFSGVDQTIISSVLGNDVRGRKLRLFRAWLDSDHAVVDTFEVFTGFQNRKYEILEERAGDGGSTGTVTVRVRAVSRLSELGEVRAVRTNPTTLENLHARALFDAADRDGDFFLRVASLVGKRIFWGTEQPDSASSGDSGVTGEDPGSEEKF